MKKLLVVLVLGLGIVSCQKKKDCKRYQSELVLVQMEWENALLEYNHSPTELNLVKLNQQTHRLETKNQQIVKACK